MYINMKKIYRYFAMLIVGLSLIFYGVIEAVVEDHSMEQPTDAEIIERARELGMIGVDEYYLKNTENNE